MSAHAAVLGRLLALLMLTATCHGAAFVFERVEIGSESEQVLVDADLNYQLSEAALEALEHGVPLTFELHVQLRRSSAWIWQSDVAEIRLRSVLRYHPLSSLYELRDLQTGDLASFATREAALRRLGQIRDLPVARRDELEPGVAYVLRLSAHLDVDALPLPLRPQAYISRDWSLASETWEWQLRR